MLGNPSQPTSAPRANIESAGKTRSLGQLGLCIENAANSLRRHCRHTTFQHLRIGVAENAEIAGGVEKVVARFVDDA